MVQSYRDLDVWKKAMHMVKNIYIISSHFPKDELYGLTSQMRRCAVSIPSNIAEGHNRDSLRDYLRFISIARGSAAELETQLLISLDLKFINDKNYTNIDAQLDEISRMLRGLQKSLKAKLERDLSPSLAPTP